MRIQFFPCALVAACADALTYLVLFSAQQVADTKLNLLLNALVVSWQRILIHVPDVGVSQMLSQSSRHLFNDVLCCHVVFVVV
jgi:hypothetical protein